VIATPRTIRTAGVACRTLKIPECKEASRPLQGFNETLLVHWLEELIQRFVARGTHSLFFR
jgi:hypothetical protein